MRSPTTKKKSKNVSTPVAILVIVAVLALAGLIGWKMIQPKQGQGVLTREASLAAGSRYKWVVERWNKEVEQAKKEGRAPDERLRPRPTSMMQSGNRPLGMEGFGPGSLATAPGQGGGQQGGGGPAGPGAPPAGR